MSIFSKSTFVFGPELGARLKALRKRRGLSLRDLAAQSGLSQSFLGAVERGRSDIAVGRLAQVAAVLMRQPQSALRILGRSAIAVDFPGEQEIWSTELALIPCSSRNVLNVSLLTYGI
jgi:transcriptional regulator with XRE-family HTH domain